MDQQGNKFLPDDAAKQHFEAYGDTLESIALEAFNRYVEITGEASNQAYAAAIKRGKTHEESLREASLVSLAKLSEDFLKSLEIVSSHEKYLADLESAGNYSAIISEKLRYADALGQHAAIESLMTNAALFALGKLPPSDE